MRKTVGLYEVAENCFWWYPRLETQLRMNTQLTWKRLLNVCTDNDRVLVNGVT